MLPPLCHLFGQDPEDEDRPLKERQAPLPGALEVGSTCIQRLALDALPDLLKLRPASTPELVGACVRTGSCTGECLQGGSSSDIAPSSGGQQARTALPAIGARRVSAQL